MSSGRRLEYEKGPRLEDDGESDAESPENERAESDSGDEPEPAGRPRANVPPWAAGLVSGTGAFAVVFAVFYQVVAAMAATGRFGGAETEPSRTVLAGLLSLANHGAVIELNGEPIETGMRTAFTVGLASHITALIPMIVLVVGGYLLVRHVRLETRREAGIAIGTCIASYVALTVVLAATSEWAPEEAPANGGPETIAVATDVTTVVAVSRTALVFVLLGAAVAALPRLLEVGAGPLESTARTD